MAVDKSGDKQEIVAPVVSGRRLVQELYYQLQSIYKKIIDEQPLPINFPFDFMLEAIFLTSFTIGVRFGGVESIETFVLGLLPPPLLFSIVYIALPTICYCIHRNYELEFTKMDYRVILTVVSFILGIGSSAFNGSYYLENGPPSYFIPGIVGLAFQILGPHLTSSRKELIFGSVGAALLFGISLANVRGALTASLLFSLTVAAIIAAINLQILIAEINSGKVDMTETHIISLTCALYQHLLFSRLLGDYQVMPTQKTKLSLKAAIFN